MLFLLASASLLAYLSRDSNQGAGLIAPAADYAHYFLIGICAAVIANATGAGGGIIFLPSFIALGLSADQALATSFAIQCFGMTSGTLAWLIFRQQEANLMPEQWQSFIPIVLVSALSSVVGLVGAQRLLSTPPINVELLFAVFSLAVGCLIFFKALKMRDHMTGRTSPVTGVELLSVAMVCLIGGVITAWLSVGVGEILAIYLIFLGFRVNLAIAAAVAVSSITVLSGVGYYAHSSSPIVLPVLIYAAPGALLGGILARHLATLLGGRRLKLMMSAWIALSGVVYLFMSL
jgi:uncharacterized membrane protein YfcA